MPTFKLLHMGKEMASIQGANEAGLKVSRVLSRHACASALPVAQRGAPCVCALLLGEPALSHSAVWPPLVGACPRSHNAPTDSPAHF